jgi:hypothetical protein
MKRPRNSIEDDVAAIADLSRAELAARWQAAHGHPPPKGIRQELLVRSATWHLQAKRLGGLSAETRRLLRSAIDRVESELAARDRRAMGSADQKGKALDVDIADVNQIDPPSVSPAPRSSRRLAPGARLMREWNGKTYVVDVIEEGFVFQATVHKSLTAIAHQITGTHWSGPRFFGL